MKRFSLVFCLFAFFFVTSVASQEAKPKPLRALLIAGGCCHDYTHQQEALCKGIQSRANVRVDVYWTDNSTTAPVLPLYSRLNWAEEYDVIIHDECAADIKDPALVDRIVQVHQKTPAVHLHCAMHSFRTGTDAWFKHLGLQSNSHGPQEPIAIHFADSVHPITQTLSDWTTVREELYNNVKVFSAQPLAIGKQIVGVGEKQKVEEAIVVWTNESEGARSFSTSLGHNTETVEDPRYLELVTRGLLWACGKLSPEYLQPYEGDNQVTFIDKNKFKSPEEMSLGTAPDNATLVKTTASSTQGGHDSYHAIDGKTDSRWCADGASFPQWLQLEFAIPHRVSEIEIVWESPGAAYQYRVEGSADGTNWLMLQDKSDNKNGNQDAFKVADQTPIKFIKVTGLGSFGGWCSIREVKVKGDGVGPLWPADPKQDNGEFIPMAGDPFSTQGNELPRIVKLSAQQEAEILKDVEVANGFEATVFAAPPAVNYPVFVAATVDGTLYVSSDGNGSLGREPQRGRVIRLRDLDGDGRADETKVFCEIDAPRGLVWDHDRLYLMHPPHLSAFIDHDVDGVADEQKTLVKNLAFDYDQRPADHTTNGVSLGVDGWLYIAGGDFGFVDAEGTDGRKLTHRGGGVIRVRPDGSGLEIYSTGTRNILEVAISPQMDLFARDNTNDGGGWDVRLHHFSGNDDHGYPRLFKNFGEECVQPLADYGGGSGCGAVFIDEPGFGVWNNAPFTADWGTGALYRHTVSAQGATFAETTKPESFIRMTRPTDADVDGNSRVYCASWRGATFNWNGPDVGYIVCVKPQDFQPSPMLGFSTASESELVKELKSASYRRRMEAERELMRRGKPANQWLLKSSLASRTPERTLVAHIQAHVSIAEILEALASSDPLVVHTAIRCLADRNVFAQCIEALDERRLPSGLILRALAMMHEPQVVDALSMRLSKVSDPNLRRELLSALCRLHFREGEWRGDSWGTRPDTRGPYYQPEPWSETPKIATVLQQMLNKGTPEQASELIELMQRNRIQSSDALDRMIELAEAHEPLLAPTISQLANANDIPPKGVDLLLRVAGRKDASARLLADAISGLSRLNTKEASEAMLVAISSIHKINSANEEQSQARNMLVNAPNLDAQVATFESAANRMKSEVAIWADVALVTIAGKKNSSPESLELAKKSIDNAWEFNDRKMRLMQAVANINNHYLDAKIWTAVHDKDASVAQLAKSLVEQMKITPPTNDDSPKIGSLSIADVAGKVISTHGDVSIGEQVFSKANCIACHSVRQNEVQKGPYLGNISKTYKRIDLIVAILEPSNTIAQGFATNVILTEDGLVLNGFVTSEQGDRVTIRDQTGKEFTVMKETIEERKTSPTSVMPSGVMNDYTTHELASLLDFVESLAK